MEIYLNEFDDKGENIMKMIDISKREYFAIKILPALMNRGYYEKE